MNRVTASVIALGSVLTGKALVACGLRRAPDGWRRTVGLLLRSEPTRFALSAFGVRVPAPRSGSADDARLEHRAAAGLHSYLATQPDAHFALEWGPSVTVRRRRKSIDLVVMEYDAAGALAAITPYLADRAPEACDPSLRGAVHQAIVAAYNRTRALPERDRPHALRRAADSDIGPRAGASALAQRAYAHRLVDAACLSFERIDACDPDARFRPPAFHARRSLGFGFLTFVMRPAVAVNTVDVWVSAHHVGLDGVPLQEMLSGLEQAWGTADDVTFPPPDPARPFMAPRVCSVDGERAVEETLAFVDFTPVVALRQALNARCAANLRAPATFGAVLAWLLSDEPEFAGVRIASTVDVAASNGYDRDVDVVPLRPADYRTGSDPWRGFPEFVNEFNRLIALSRERTSPLRQALSTAELLPPAVHADAVRSNPAALDDTFGSLCITIIRDAKVFVSPMTDMGLGHGFFAIGNTALAASNGARVTAVTVKGDAGRIGHHLAVLQRVIARAAAQA
jgi:hypothetical protein